MHVDSVIIAGLLNVKYVSNLDFWDETDETASITFFKHARGFKPTIVKPYSNIILLMLSY